ncbi:MAG: 50S ribosomal protein L34e [Nanoarchaeota archaeon]|nr:50S ribosomal protein L34e [Nanoarchaeota archaeon]
MRRADRGKLRTKKKTPSGITKWVMKKRRVSHAKCGICKNKLNRARLDKAQVSKLSKTQRRPSRPYPELCSKCMRAKLKGLVK